MIVYPKRWTKIGQPIRIEDIAGRIFWTLIEIGCPYLSLSGGLDSSLILYFMAQAFDKVYAFTIGFPETHPDIKYSRLVAKTFGNITHEVYIPSVSEVADEVEKKSGPDVGVRLFYRFLAGKGIPGIIACDGIDEYMAGYYDHQQHPDEATYYKHIRRLRDEHLKPLNDNSGGIKVYLPYLDHRLLSLLNQIPLSDKVDREKRKKIMVDLAERKVPREVIDRWKYGFCDALKIKENKLQK